MSSPLYALDIWRDGDKLGTMTFIHTEPVPHDTMLAHCGKWLAGVAYDIACLYEVDPGRMTSGSFDCGTVRTLIHEWRHDGYSPWDS
jgi:hypothetical protein